MTVLYFGSTISGFPGKPFTRNYICYIIECQKVLVELVPKIRDSFHMQPEPESVFEKKPSHQLNLNQDLPVSGQMYATQFPLFCIHPYKIPHPPIPCFRKDDPDLFLIRFLILTVMRLQVNLIPALAYALVMLFSNMTGMSGTAEQSSKKQQAVSLPTAGPEMNRQKNCVYVAKNGQVILSNGTSKGSLEWKIPYKPETGSVFL